MKCFFKTYYVYWMYNCLKVERHCRKGAKQVSTLVSADRGHLATVCCAVNTKGNSVPSRWMTTKHFQLFLHNFVRHIQATKHNPVLLLCDNHKSPSHIVLMAWNMLLKMV